MRNVPLSASTRSSHELEVFSSCLKRLYGFLLRSSCAQSMSSFLSHIYLPSQIEYRPRVRKGGNIRKIILSTINAYQLHLGTDLPLLSQDPKMSPHAREKYILHHIYLWEELRAPHDQLQIPTMWRPHKSNDKDEAIIDAVLRTLQARTPALVKNRLYLHVTMLSEILNADGTSIQPWAMYGTKQNDTALEYPYQPKPPPIAWKTWRDALHATYLDRYRTDITFPLYRPIGPPAPSNITMNHWPQLSQRRHDDEGNYRSFTTCIQAGGRNCSTTT